MPSTLVLGGWGEQWFLYDRRTSLAWLRLPHGGSRPTRGDLLPTQLSGFWGAFGSSGYNTQLLVLGPAVDGVFFSWPLGCSFSLEGHSSPLLLGKPSFPEGLRSIGLQKQERRALQALQRSLGSIFKFNGQHSGIFIWKAISSYSFQ